MIWRICWVIAVVVTVSPPVDSFLDESMSRHMLLQMPLLAVLGYAAGSIWQMPRFRFASLGLTAIIFAMGSMVFWMLPRSLDTAVTVPWVDQAMHLNMLAAGWSLVIGLPRLPFHTKISFGIYSLAMALTAGLVYVAVVVPVCSAYSVQHQNEAGALLLWVGGTLFIFLLGRGAFLLAANAFISPQESRNGSANRL
jgi:cytochrome c oxidase assembly factor CtaG